MTDPMNVMLNQAIAASGDEESNVVKMRDFNPSVGEYSVQLNLTGTGTVKLELFISNDGVNFIEHTADIATGLTAGSYISALDPIKAAYWKFKITETGGANAVTASLYLNIF